MKKILYGILAICLVAIMASSVNALASFDYAPADQTWLHDTTKTIDLLDLNCDGAGHQCVSSVTSGDALGLTDTTGHFTGSGTCSSTTECKITITPLNDWAGTESVTFWINSITNPAPGTTDLTVTNTAPVATAYTPSPILINEDNTIEITLVAIDADGDDITYSVVTAPIHGTLSSIDQVTHKLTYTPTSNYAGPSDSFTFKVNDGIVDSNILTVPITISAVDDPLTVLTIPDQKWTKGTSKTIDLKSYFSDPDDTLTYTWTPTTLTNIDISTTGNGVITFTPKVSSWKGTEKINFTATSTKGSLTSNEVKLVVRNQPDFICEEGEVGELSIDSVSDPDDGDNFKPGENIKIKLNVDNNYDEDLDVVVVAYLYDETDDSVLESVESDAEEIKDGKDQTFEFYLDIPLDEDVDEDHDYKLLLKVYEDGNEDEHCVENTEIDLDLTREDKDVIISSVDLIPSTASPGETVEFTVKVVNIGATDEDDVTIRLKETTLGLDLTSAAFDLEDATSDDNDKTERFTFTVPSNIAAGTYSINVAVYDEDDDVFDESDDAEKFVSLVVSGSAAVQSEDIKIEMVGSLPSTIEADKTYSIPVKLTNNKAIREMVTLRLINIDDWATSTSEKILTLDASKSETVYLSLKANEEIGEGKYSATIEAKDSTGKIYTKTITLGAEEDGEGMFENIDMNTIFYIVGYIVLIIVAIFFIKLIFSRGKGKVKEVRL